MDRHMNCNVLDCNADLPGEAIVTSCSHIFCIRCATGSGLLDENQPQRLCPACTTYLPNKDDVVSNYLNPTEDWKANILSGLSPTAIMECAGKALSFWGYQNTMKMTFLEARNRGLQTQYDSMVAKYENALNEANMARDNGVRELEAMKAELDHARQENTNLAMNLKEKSRKLSQTEELYSKIKRQAMLEAIDHTASHVLGHNLEVANARLSGRGQSEYNQQATHQQHQMYNHGNSPGYNQQPQPHISSRTNPQQSGPSLGFGSNTYRPAQPPHNPSTGIPPIPTPLGQRPRFPGALAAVHGVVAGTPRATPRAAPAPAHQSGSGGIRQPYLDPGQIARNPPRFTGGSLAGKPQGLASSRHAVSGAATEGYNRGTGANAMPPPSGYQNNRGGPGRY